MEQVWDVPTMCERWKCNQHSIYIQGDSTLGWWSIRSLLLHKQRNHNTGNDKATFVSSYMAPKFLSPKTTPTPMMCPTTPQAKVSAKVNPAGSPVCSPESRTSNLRPAVAFRLAEGARPNLPANSIRVVLVTII